MKSIKGLILFLICGFIASGCSIEYGQQVTSSHYVYPNSNVTPLGYTTAELKKFGILFPSQVRKNDYEQLFNEALSKHQGADIIVDMGIDVKYTRVPIPILTLWFTTFTLQGTAASMEVGEQDLTHSRNRSPKESDESGSPSTEPDKSDVQSEGQPKPDPAIQSGVQSQVRSSGAVRPAQSPVRFGIKTGINFANYEGDLLDPRAGLLLGGFLNYELADIPLTLQPEVFYGQRKSVAVFGDFEEEFTVNLLEAPVLTKWRFGDSGSFQPHLLAGPHAVFDLDNSENQLGGTVGIGTDISLSGNSLALEARYGFFDGVNDFSITGGIIF